VNLLLEEIYLKINCALLISFALLLETVLNSNLAVAETVYNTPSKNESGDLIFKFRNSDGVLSFSDRRPKGTTRYELLKFDCYACQKNNRTDFSTTPLELVKYRSETKQAAEQNKLSEALIRAVIHAESNFKATALSSKGAIGLMQLMPTTAQELGVANPTNTSENIAGGSQYLAQQLARFNNNERLALAAYNAGPTAVERYKGVPPYPETQRYIERVLTLKSRYEKAL
jgi:hypothetical protein